jgi:hypothetical protein
MLDRLPVELLIHILQLAAPLEHTPLRYALRRKNVRSWTLVSKHLHRFAAPLYYEVYAVTCKKDAKRLLRGRMKAKMELRNGNQVKLLVLRGT